MRNPTGAGGRIIIVCRICDRRNLRWELTILYFGQGPQAFEPAPLHLGTSSLLGSLSDQDFAHVIAVRKKECRVCLLCVKVNDDWTVHLQE